MNRRVLLAVALSTGVIMLSNWWFTPPTPPSGKTSPRVVAPSSTPSASGAETLAPLPKGTLPLATPSALTDARPITISTPLVRLSLSRFGGRLTSWQLLRYFQDEDTTQTPTLAVSAPAGPRPIELIPNHPTRLPLEIDIAGESDAKVTYESSTTSVSLAGAGDHATVTLEGRTPSGWRVTKTIHVRGDAYEAAVRVSLFRPTAAEAPGPVTLYWERSLTSNEFEEHQADIMVGDTVLRERLKKVSGRKEFDQGFRWLAHRQRFAITALYVPTGLTGQGALESGDPSVKAAKLSVTYPSVPLGGRTGTAVEWRVFGGPLTHDATQAPGVKLEHALDYGSFLGLNFSWLGLWLLMGLNALYAWTHNYGLAIILLTVLMKIVLWWPSKASIMSSRRMQALQPKMEDLKHRYKDNPKQLQVETMRLYRDHKINPLSGCLMMLPQIPLFIALYSILVNAAELQGQPFAGWLVDLSKKDPYYLLPLLMGGTMFLQQKMMPTTMDPAQAKIMLFMPVMMTFMFVNLPSGVVLYWTVQNVLSIIQQWWMLRTPVELVAVSPAKK